MTKQEITTEEILWKAIKDLEDDNVAFNKDDPINGWLFGKTKALSKKNVSEQSAKYNENNNNKPVSRPTIDTYPEVVAYINNKKTVVKAASIEEKYAELLSHNESLIKKNKELEELNNNLAFENYKLNEKRGLKNG